MRASDFNDVVNVLPVEWKDFPEEVRHAVTELRSTGAAAGTFFLKSDLTQGQKQTQITIAWVGTIALAILGMGIAGLAAVAQSWHGVLIILGLFGFCTILSWFFWVLEAKAVAADPWYDSMVCTPHFLLINSMRKENVINLDEWLGVSMYPRSNTIFLTTANGRFSIGAVQYVGREAVEAFANRLHQRILQLRKTPPDGGK